MDMVDPIMVTEPDPHKKLKRTVLGKSIVRQAAFALQIMILLVVSSGAVSLWFSRAIETSVQQTQAASKQALKAADLQVRWLKITSILDTLSVTRSMPNALQDLDQQIVEMETELSSLANIKIGLSTEMIIKNQQIVASMQQSEKELKTLLDKFIPLVEQGRWGTALQLRQSNIANIQTKLINDIGQLSTNMQSDIATQTTKIIQMQSIARNLSFLIVGLGIFFSIFFIWYARQTIQKPLNQLVADLELITQAETPAELRQVAALERADEIGKLSQAFAKLMSWLQESFRTLEDQVAERTLYLAQRARQMEISAQVARDIVDSRDPEALYYKSVNTIRDRFNLYHVGIFLVDSLGEYAVLRSATGQAGREMLERNHRLKIGQTGLVGYVAQSGKPRIASDVGQDTVHYKNPSLPDTRAEAALPLTVSGEVIGVLDVQSEKEGAFDDETIAILQIVADQLAVAIQNARLFDESRNNLHELQVAYQQLNQQAWEQLAQSTNLVGYEYEGYTLRPIYSINPLRGSQPPQKDDREAIQIPLTVRGVEIGSIDVWPEEGRLSPEDTHLLSVVGDRLGQTLESARLYEETRRRAERERISSEIVTKIRSTNNPQEIFQTAVSELRRALIGAPLSRSEQDNPVWQTSNRIELTTDQPSTRKNGVS